MAEPREIQQPTPQLKVSSLDETGWVVPVGWYGWCETSGPGLIATAGVGQVEGIEALIRLGEPEPESRSQAFEGRRLVRVDHGYVVLNYDTYRQRDTTAAERAKRYRERKASRRDNTVTDRNVTQAEAEAEAEAELTKVSKGARRARAKRSRIVPDTFQPTDRHKAFASEQGVDIEAELQKFKDWEFKDPKSDWNRAFARWLRTAADSARSNGKSEAVIVADN